MLLDAGAQFGGLFGLLNLAVGEGNAKGDENGDELVAIEGAEEASDHSCSPLALAMAASASFWASAFG